MVMPVARLPCRSKGTTERGDMAAVADVVSELLAAGILWRGSWSCARDRRAGDGQASTGEASFDVLGDSAAKEKRPLLRAASLPLLESSLGAADLERN